MDYCTVDKRIPSLRGKVFGADTTGTSFRGRESANEPFDSTADGGGRKLLARTPFDSITGGGGGLSFACTLLDFGEGGGKKHVCTLHSTLLQAGEREGGTEYQGGCRQRYWVRGARGHLTL